MPEATIGGIVSLLVTCTLDEITLMAQLQRARGVALHTGRSSHPQIEAAPSGMGLRTRAARCFALYVGQDFRDLPL